MHITLEKNMALEVVMVLVSLIVELGFLHL
jgi:hypothetical protein